MSIMSLLARTCSGAHLANADEQIRGSDGGRPSLRLLEGKMSLGAWPMTDILSRIDNLIYACSVPERHVRSFHHTCNNTASTIGVLRKRSPRNPGPTLLAYRNRPTSKHQPTQTPSQHQHQHNTSDHQPTRPIDPAPPKLEPRGPQIGNCQFLLLGPRARLGLAATLDYCTLLLVFKCLCLCLGVCVLVPAAASSAIAFPIDCAICLPIPLFPQDVA
jgi:hypothetical protein